MHIHFIGIGGIGMSALAQLCRQQGHSITGSDTGISPVTTMLERKGIAVLSNQSTQNIVDSIDLVIYTEAVDVENVERKEAVQKNIPQKSYFEYVGEISNQYRTIAIAGTHGKTTTTGLLASAMMEAELDPSVVVGAQLPLLDNTNYRHGKGQWFLVEACEYRENFRFIHPEIVLLTNIEVDHVDYYKSEKQYVEAYSAFIKNARVVIAHKSDTLSVKILKDFKGEILWADDEKIPPLNIIGSHNKDNAKLCASLLQSLSIDEKGSEKFLNGLCSFSGSARRQEHLGTVQGCEIFDDYGHHPTEIEATYKAFQEAFPNKTIGLIFQPHQYSRTAELFDDFSSVLNTISPLGIMPIYEARDTDEDKKSVSTEQLIKATNGVLIQTHKDVDLFLQNNGKKIDILVFMGAGNISTFAHNFISSSLPE